MKPKDVIELLGLQKHPREGGYFRETYRSDGTTDGTIATHGGVRNYSTCIYYLVTAQEFSEFHRLKTDEVFHFYAGDAVDLHMIESSGNLVTLGLGSDLSKGDRPQAVVPQNTWQGLCLKEGGAWALLGCTVAPGFDYLDYEHGSAESLLKEFPSLRNIILKLTRSSQ
jgi:predicted cupin superfamily sugar epimerase